MRQHCDDAEAQLKLTEEASRSLLEQAGSLRYERWVLDFIRRDVLMSIISKAGGGNTKVHRTTIPRPFHAQRR